MGQGFQQGILPYLSILNLIGLLQIVHIYNKLYHDKVLNRMPYLSAFNAWYFNIGFLIKQLNVLFKHSYGVRSLRLLKVQGSLYVFCCVKYGHTHEFQKFGSQIWEQPGVGPITAHEMLKRKAFDLGFALNIKSDPRTLIYPRNTLRTDFHFCYFLLSARTKIHLTQL